MDLKLSLYQRARATNTATLGAGTLTALHSKLTDEKEPDHEIAYGGFFPVDAKANRCDGRDGDELDGSRQANEDRQRVVCWCCGVELVVVRFPLKLFQGAVVPPVLAV